MIRQLQSRPSALIYLGVILSRLVAMFIALSLMVGPLAMDRAMAAAPATSHSQMTAKGHCQPASEGKADKGIAEPCCAAMCATSAVVPQASASEPLFDRLQATSAPAGFHRGVLSEIATPPHVKSTLFNRFHGVKNEKDTDRDRLVDRHSSRMAASRAAMSIIWPSISAPNSAISSRSNSPTTRSSSGSKGPSR